MQSRKTKIILPLLMIIVLAACGENGEPFGPLLQDRNTLGEITDLNGTDWSLVLLNGKGLLPNTQITLRFRGSAAGGFAGCNSYGAKYAVRASRALKFEEVTITEMACMSPAGVLDQEQAFMKAILDARSFRVKNNRLEIGNAAGKTVLTFSRRMGRITL